MKKTLIIACTFAALAVGPAALAKDHGNGHGHGKGKHAADAHNGAWTNPAGRAHPHGMPPGQAKKIARAQGDLVTGAVLPSGYPGYQVVPNYQSYNLPAAPVGHEYVRVGDNVYLRQTTTGVIADVIANLFR